MFLLLACAPPEPVLIAGAHTDLSVTLVNPTSCDACDPFHGVDTLRLEVTRNGEVVATDSFAYPDEAPTLPDLEGFGTVRLELVGLGEGRAISAGRTPEIALIPGEAQVVSMLFLPANRALPLTSEMLAQRSRHVAVRLRDGRVLLLGGQEPAGDRAFATTELFDPATTSFMPNVAVLPTGAVDPRVAWTADDDLLIAGGHSGAGNGSVPLADASLYDGDSAEITPVASMTTARDGHCFMFYREKQGLVLGGSAEETDAEYVRQDDAGHWTYSSLSMRDFDPSHVTGCATIEGERLFVMGTEAANTGVWQSDDGDEPAESFRPIGEAGAGDVRYARGAMIVPMADGRAWVGGGAEAVNAIPATRFFEPGDMRFVEAGPLLRPRFDGQWAPWIREGWIAAGCGWTGSDRATSASTVELVELEGTHSSLTELDRDRPGCALTVLRDGSVLITGGYGPSDTATVAAAILVPLPEED